MWVAHWTFSKNKIMSPNLHRGPFGSLWRNFSVLLFSPSCFSALIPVVDDGTGSTWHIMGTLSPQTTHISAPLFAPAAPSESQYFLSEGAEKRQVQREDAETKWRLHSLSFHCAAVGRQLCFFKWLKAWLCCTFVHQWISWPPNISFIMLTDTHAEWGYL